MPISISITVIINNTSRHR